MSVLLIQGDARSIPLADRSVHCVVTSPPYWGLRDYGVEGQLGLEKTPDEYIRSMVEVFREVKRVLRDDGTLWLNMGDSYASHPGQRVQNGPRDDVAGWKQATNIGSCTIGSRDVSGLKPKDLVGVPWMLAFALRADGWYLRSEIIWAKPNPMPESVMDRPTKAHEQIFLLAKSERYYYDAEAIKEQSVYGFGEGGHQRFGAPNGKAQTEYGSMVSGEIWNSNGTRNKRTVWEVNPQPFPEAHFATFPEDLIKPCILAGTSLKGACAKCGTPWERVLEKKPATMNIRVRDNKKQIIDKKSGVAGKYGASEKEIENYGPEEMGKSKTVGWKPLCKCGTQEVVPCTVLDPFIGSGTAALVARHLQCHAVGMELNPAYLEIAKRRLAQSVLSFTA